MKHFDTHPSQVQGLRQDEGLIGGGQWRQSDGGSGIKGFNLRGAG